jgi:hypothetical protein
MATSYDRAIPTFSAAQQRDIEQLLDDWSRHNDIGRTVSENVRGRERFLWKQHMLSLLRVVLRYVGKKLADFEIAYEALCHRKSGLGGNVTLKTLPAKVGRVVDRQQFQNFLLWRYPTIFQVPPHAKMFVDKLISGTPPLSAAEEALVTSAHLSWVTFDEVTGEPFSFVKHGVADEVRACLGLDPTLRNTALLLEYQRPAKARLIRPTVADAALFVFFSPPPKNLDAHGLTVPWPAQFLASSIPGFVPKPRPEALQDPLTFDCVRRPVRELP